MLIDICINGKNYLRYEAEQAPAIGETGTVFNSEKIEKKLLIVVSVDHLINVGYSGKVNLSVVTVNTKES